MDQDAGAYGTCSPLLPLPPPEPRHGSWRASMVAVRGTGSSGQVQVVWAILGHLNMSPKLFVLLAFLNFLIRSHSEEVGVRSSTHELLGTYSTRDT
jgi:hypothetical protein